MVGEAFREMVEPSHTVTLPRTSEFKCDERP